MPEDVKKLIQEALEVERSDSAPDTFSKPYDEETKDEST